jgi:hypothetical protein
MQFDSADSGNARHILHLVEVDECAHAAMLPSRAKPLQAAADVWLLTCVPYPVCRIALCFVAIYVLWDMKAVFYTIWQPFDWLVGYSDPRKGPQDRLHGEWPTTNRLSGQTAPTITLKLSLKVR